MLGALVKSYIAWRVLRRLVPLALCAAVVLALMAAGRHQLGAARSPGPRGAARVHAGGGAERRLGPLIVGAQRSLSRALQGQAP